MNALAYVWRLHRRVLWLSITALVVLPIGLPTPLAVAGVFGPSNFWECILDQMPGAQNDLVAQEIVVQCQKRFPDTSAVPDKDKVGGLITAPHASDCLLKYAKSTPSAFAAKMIFTACNVLYWP